MKSDELNDLLDSLLDGDISEADFLRLEAELSVDPNARQQYYQRIKLSVLLENVAVESPPPEGRAVEPSNDDDFESKPGWKVAFALMAFVAASLMVMLAVEWYSADSQDAVVAESPADSKLESAATGFAVIAGQADAVWDDDATRNNGSLVPSGEIRLKSGVAQLELFSGVMLVVEGDARFSIISPMEVAVRQGKIRARVPEPAHGFRIRTAEGEVVDLGTEFAVNVSDQGSEVHVLDGEIEWKPRGSESKRMLKGESLRHSKDGRSLAADPSAFVGANELSERLQARSESRRQRWLEHAEEQRADPRLVALFQVAQSDPSTRRLPNRSLREGGSSEGAVVAAAAAPSRWGQPDGAFNFSPAGSRVRLTVPGEFRSISMMCWVKINSLDRLYNSLFLTDGHEEREPHWQIMNDGRMFFSVKAPKDQIRFDGELQNHVFYSPPFWNASLSGQWIMLCTVYDVDQMRVVHYLNGKPLSSEPIPERWLVDSVQIGDASICNWSEPMYRTDPTFVVRNLNGSLDEFAIYSAALTDQEVTDLFRAGNPHEK